jgi:plastocyanin
MRRVFVIFMVLLSVFLAIGCTGNKQATPAETPAKETATPAETPTKETTTPVNTSVAASGTPQPAGGGKIVDVAIQGFAFSPESVKILAGDTVRWTNMDSATHIVKGGSTFESGSLAKGDTYEFMFTKPGVYDYICSIHPSMKGTVTVEAKK